MNRIFILSLSLLQLISWGSVFYGFALFVAPIETELGIVRVQSSLGFSLALLMEGLFAYAVGRLIDRGHERFVMTLGSTLLGVGLLFLGTVNSLAGYLVAWTILGVGLAGTLYPPVFAVVIRRFPYEFRSAIITMTFLGGLASTAFIPLISFMINEMGWRNTAQFLGFLNFIICAPAHFALLKNAPESVAIKGDLEPKKSSLNRSKSDFELLIKSPTFLYLCVFNVLLMAVTAAVPAHMINLLREAGLAPWLVIAVPAGVGVLQVVGRLGLYFLENRIDSHFTNRWSPALIPIGILALLTGYGEPAWAVVFVFAFGLGNGMLTIVRGTSVAQYLGTEYVGSLNGLIGFPVALARAASPLILGALWTKEYGYVSGLYFLLAISILGVLAIRLAQGYSKQKA